MSERLLITEISKTLVLVEAWISGVAAPLKRLLFQILFAYQGVAM